MKSILAIKVCLNTVLEPIGTEYWGWSIYSGFTLIIVRYKLYKSAQCNKYNAYQKPYLNKMRGSMAQRVALLSQNWSVMSFKSHQRLLLYPWAKNFTLIAKYWLVPGTDSSVILISKINQLKQISIN